MMCLFWQLPAIHLRFQAGRVVMKDVSVLLDGVELCLPDRRRSGAGRRKKSFTALKHTNILVTPDGALKNPQLKEKESAERTHTV